MNLVLGRASFSGRVKRCFPESSFSGSTVLGTCCSNEVTQIYSELCNQNEVRVSRKQKSSCQLTIKMAKVPRTGVVVWDDGWWGGSIFKSRKAKSILDAWEPEAGSTEANSEGVDAASAEPAEGHRAPGATRREDGLKRALDAIDIGCNYAESMTTNRSALEAYDPKESKGHSVKLNEFTKSKFITMLISTAALDPDLIHDNKEIANKVSEALTKVSVVDYVETFVKESNQMFVDCDKYSYSTQTLKMLLATMADAGVSCTEDIFIELAVIRCASGWMWQLQFDDVIYCLDVSLPADDAWITLAMLSEDGKEKSQEDVIIKLLCAVLTKEDEAAANCFRCFIRAVLAKVREEGAYIRSNTLKIILEKDVAPLSDLDEHEDDAIVASTTAVRGALHPLHQPFNKGSTGRKLLMDADLRRLQAGNDQRFNAKLQALVIPEKLSFPASSELKVTTPQMWDDLQQGWTDVGSQCSSRFKKKNEHLLAIKAALEEGTDSVINDLVNLQLRDVGETCYSSYTTFTIGRSPSVVC